jgi:hypothetical protein
MSALGKAVLSQGREIAEVDAPAKATGEMFAAHLSARDA